MTPDLATSASSTAIPALLGNAELIRRAFTGVDLAPLGLALRDRAAQNPADANALLDLSILLQLSQQPQLAMSVQEMALQQSQHYRLPGGQTGGLRLLIIVAPGPLMDTTPIDFLFEGSTVNAELLFVGPTLPQPETLPEHDLIFVAVGECDRNRAVLQQLPSLLAKSTKPVLNRPERIEVLSRDRTAAALRGVAGLQVSSSTRVAGSMLSMLATGMLPLAHVLPGGRFPLIIRPVNSQAGQELAKVGTPGELAVYLAQSSASEFFIAQWLDYHSSDGQYRKYRVVLIDGQAFLCHLAISDNWIVHYLNAGMADDAEKRAEEAAAMDSFAQGFAQRHGAALAAANQRLGLDYWGMDCAETQDGQLLIFEVDTAMVVHDMDPPELFPYKHAHMQHVFAAFRALLARAAASPAR